MSIYKDRCFEYVEWVKSHPTQTNKRIRQAISRFEEDLRREDLEMKWDKVDAVCTFAETCKQTQEEWAGKPIHLYPWQVFVFANMYGFYRKSNGERRFKTAYLQVARKNGKTLLSAVPALWDLLSRNSAEIYTVATKRAQAMRCWSAVSGFVEQSEVLNRHCKIRKSTAHISYLNSKIVALGADSKREDGLSPSVIIADELGAMQDMSAIKILRSGMGVRKNPQVWEITSCSEDLASAGYIEYKYGCKVLDGTVKGDDADSFFTMLYGLEDDDDWTDPNAWIKANPMLPYGVIPDSFLPSQCELAKHNPVYRGEFITKLCARWQVSSKNWIPHDKWEAVTRVKSDPNPDETYFCTVGLDLSMSKDMTAVTYDVFQNDIHHMFHMFYCPEKELDRKVHSDNELFKYWWEEGFITATDGDIVDYSRILTDILEFNGKFRINEVLYDSWNSSALVSTLVKEGFTCVPIPMGVKFSPKLKLYEEQLYKATIRDTNPVMEWMANNACLKIDNNSNYFVQKPNGKDDPQRIDGIITSALTVGRTMELYNSGSLDMRSKEEQEKAFMSVLAMFR